MIFYRNEKYYTNINGNINSFKDLKKALEFEHNQKYYNSKHINKGANYDRRSKRNS